AVVQGGRVVVRIGEVHRDGGGGGAAVAVTDGVGEGVAAEVVGGRGVAEGGGVVDHGAVQGGADGGDGEGLARVRREGVVGQDVEHVAERVFGDREAVVQGGRV